MKPNQNNTIIAALVADLFAGFPIGVPDRHATIQRYTRELVKFPPHAVRLACDEVMRSGSKYPPSLPEMVATTMQHNRPRFGVCTTCGEGLRVWPRPEKCRCGGTEVKAHPVGWRMPHAEGFVF